MRFIRFSKETRLLLPKTYSKGFQLYLGKERRRLSRRRSSITLVFKNENPESQNDRRKISAMENAHNITITKVLNQC